MYISSFFANFLCRKGYWVDKMKRASVNLHQFHDVDEAGRAKIKYETLLLEHLQLQKGLISKKRKLQTAKQKRDTLLAENRFLRRRHKHLLEIQSSKAELDLIQAQNADVSERKTLEEGRNCSVDEAPSCSPYSILVAKRNTRVEEARVEGRDQIGCEPLRIENKVRKRLADGRRVSKKKVSWHDQMPLERIEEERGERKIGHEPLETEDSRNYLTDDGRVGRIKCL